MERKENGERNTRLDGKRGKREGESLPGFPVSTVSKVPAVAASRDESLA